MQLMFHVYIFKSTFEQKKKEKNEIKHKIFEFSYGTLSGGIKIKWVIILINFDILSLSGTNV